MILKKTYYTILFMFIQLAISVAEIRFEQILPNELKDKTVFSIVQDNTGYIWFGTKDGLIQYDGYSIKTFRNNPSDVNSISSNKINVLFVDSKGRLWIGTSVGLNLFNHETEHFERFLYDENNCSTLSSNDILTIYEDSENNHWIGTENGLNRYDETMNTFSRYYYSEVSVNDYNNKAIISILEKDKNTLIVGTFFRGIYLFDKKTGQLSKNGLPYPINGSINIWCLLKDSLGNIWTGTYNHGLYVLSPEFEVLNQYSMEGTSDQNRLLSNIVYGINIDDFGNIWVATDNGLSIFDTTKIEFSHYTSNTNTNAALTTNSLRTIFKDNTGNIWLGGWNSGILKVDRLKYKFNTLFHNPTLPPQKLDVNTIVKTDQNKWLFGTDRGLYMYSGEVNSQNPINSKDCEIYFSDQIILSALQDSRGNTWVGTTDMLMRFKDNIYNAQVYTARSDNQFGLASSFIYDLYEDEVGRIWIATQSGLHEYVYGTNRFRRYAITGNNSFDHRYITNLCSDKLGGLWVGTIKGLNHLNINTGEIKNYTHKLNDPKSISNGRINDIHLDGRGILWIATDAGLSVYNRASESFLQFSIEDGLLGNIINSIAEDSKGDIWLGTNDGLSHIFINPKLRNQTLSKTALIEKILNYDSSDGLHVEFFRPRVFYADDDERFYFGGVNGVVSFLPDSIQHNQRKPPVVISNFKIANKNVPIETDQSPLSKHISFTDQITLTHKQSVLTFEFVALNFTNSEKNQYAYKMEGFEDNWNYVGNQRSATYTNLDAGTYIFRVIASNNDGEWNTDGASLEIKVLPPFWKTWQAFLVYIIIITIAIILFAKNISAKHRVENELKMKALETQKAMEMSEFRNNFFTNISHEFRTPLTLIVGPLENLAEQHAPDEKLSKQLNLINRNAKRLLRLINQLLDISKIDAGHMKLKVSEGEIVESTRNIFDAFSIKASEAQIQYQFYCSHFEIRGYFDNDKIEKILYNLLANAFKFTPEKGRISVLLNLIKNDDNTNRYIEMIVHDSGPGISSKDLDKIFDRFYNLDKNNLNGIKGTGIGLSLAAQLAKVNKGSIRVESEEGNGSRFIVSLPIDRNHYTDEEIDLADEIKEQYQEVEIIEELKMIEKQEQTFFSPDPDKPLILLVEDNKDVHEYIHDNLLEEYSLLNAYDGIQGKDLALKYIPDLILTDVMMPEMNGYELCQFIKNDEKICHIPIIMLTAKASDVNQMEGFKMGADAYISKPFEINILKARLSNMIESRKKLREIFGKSFKIEPGMVEFSSMDEVFLTKTMKHIEDNMSDSDLNVEKLSNYLNMSRSQLYRKVKALTDSSPVELIRDIRIKRAAQLIKQKSHNITEIAYMVGFSDLNYFRKCFKEVYDVAPSKFETVPKDV
jgi:ligand-binding sensor domain-containing protein/signal transduction histidine kinase/DNA-binding response OmpR family regulator